MCLHSLNIHENSMLPWDSLILYPLKNFNHTAGRRVSRDGSGINNINENKHIRKQILLFIIII